MRKRDETKIVSTPWVRNMITLMDQQGFNYKSLSIEAGLGDTSVREYAVGRNSNPTKDTLSKIAKALGVSVDRLQNGIKRENLLCGHIIWGCRVQDLLGEASSSVELPPWVECPPNGKVFEFIDNSNAPLAKKGWLYIVGEPKREDRIFGDGYYVLLKSGEALIRIIKRGSFMGRYHLINPVTAEMEDNVEIDCYAEITAIVPRY